jgi:tetratricopeptide (TPR) repeat protein
MSQNNSHLNKIFSEKEEPSSEDLRVYLDGAQEGQVANRLEQAMEADPFLADAIEGIEEVGTGEFDAMVASLQSRLSKRIAVDPSKSTEDNTIEFRPAVPAKQSATRRRSSAWYLSMAASLLLLMAVGYFALAPGNSPQDIANTHYQLYSASGDRSSTASQLEKAGTLYQEGKFAEAAAIYDQIDGPTPTLLAGHAYYQTGKYDQAAERFESLIQLESNIREDAEYALAMTYLMREEVAEARGLLEGISKNRDHLYRANAKDALKDLGN